MKIKLIALVAGSMLYASCERVLDINLPEAEPKLVVEGQIETNLPPVVRLSNTIGFFGTVDTAAFFNSFVSGAVITISDDTRSVVLREYNYIFGDVRVQLYSVDSADASALTFVGEAGKTYQLKIELDGEVYESTTSIPPYNDGLDSFVTVMPTDEEALAENPNIRLVKARYTDPADEVNRLRFFTAVNGGPFFAPFYSVNDDGIINGTSSEITIERGWNRLDTAEFSRDNYFQLFDTLDIKMCAIDYNTYEFYRTLEFGYGTVGNPFSNPMVVSGNISNGALGVWAGYAAVVYRYVVLD